MSPTSTIGSLPGTIEDRSIIIAMRRRLPSEKITRFRSDRATHLLYDRIAERLWTGGSLIISDQPLSGETGPVGTDLTVKVR